MSVIAVLSGQVSKGVVVSAKSELLVADSESREALAQLDAMVISRCEEVASDFRLPFSANSVEATLALIDRLPDLLIDYRFTVSDDGNVESQFRMRGRVIPGSVPDTRHGAVVKACAILALFLRARQS